MQGNKRMLRTPVRLSLFGLSLLVSQACISDAFAQPVPSSARASSMSCSQVRGLRSLHSREPTKVTFVNQSGMYRGLNWIDLQGNVKSFGGMNSGETKTVDTFRTHPWMISTGPGDCIQVIMPAAEPSTVLLK